jgi:hypothetical protein
VSRTEGEIKVLKPQSRLGKFFIQVQALLIST